MHRCNQARKAVRELDPEGLCPYDRFIIRAAGDYVVIEPRAIFRPELFEPLPGPQIESDKPLDLEEIIDYVEKPHE